MSHKRNFEQYIECNYKPNAATDEKAITKHFQSFLASCLEMIPNEGEPADGYMYNAHMGAFVRDLARAKEEFVQASYAFHEKRGSGIEK